VQIYSPFPSSKCGISKSFGNVSANADVDLLLAPAKSSACSEENGAARPDEEHFVRRHQADSGTIAVEGKPVAHPLRGGCAAPASAWNAPAFPSRAAPFVLDNLLVGLPGKRRPRQGRRACRPQAHRAAIRAGARSGPAGRALSVGEQQRLEIIKALFRGVRS